MDNNLFKLNATLMRFMGMYKPESKWRLPRKVLYYVSLVIWMGCLSGGLFFNIQGMIWGEGNEKISDIAINIINIELFGSILLRAFYFAKDNTEIDRLAARFEGLFVHSTKFSFRPVTMDLIMLINYCLIIGWMLFLIVAGILMTLGPILKTPMELPFKIHASYDVSDPMMYTFALLAEFIATMMMLLSHGHLDMMNASFVLLTSGQIDILASDFTNIVNDALRKNQCTEDEILNYISSEGGGTNECTKIDLVVATKAYQKNISENMSYCIKRHQNLLEFIAEYQSYISPYLLVEVNFNFSYLIFMLFTFVTIDNKSMYPPMFMYVSGCIAQIFLSMFLGDRLSSSIDNLRDELYAMPWYLCGERFLKEFKIVQLRMTKPASMYAGKLISMSLDTFLEFMKKAFSFFTMLRQVNNA